MKAETKKLLITILNIGIMIANTIISSLSGSDTSSVATIGSMALTGVIAFV